MAPRPLAKPPVSLSRGDEVPHVFIGESHQRAIPRFHSLAKNGLPGRGNAILVGEMIRGGFLDPAIRADLIALGRDGKADTRLTRRANALLLLDDGMSCEAISDENGTAEHESNYGGAAPP